VRPMLIALVMTACGVPTAAGAQAIRHGSDISWGKAGVSFDEYRADGFACAVEAINLDIADTRAAQRLVAASSALNAIDNSRRSVPVSGAPINATSSNVADFGADYGRVRDIYQPDRQFDAIESLQQQTLDACLIQRGYRQFRLTDDQKRRLRRLDRGSNERRAYLHSLAADAEVLQQQSL
jgi:hypothetical protein